MEQERKYLKSLSLGTLEVQCEAHEQLHGDITAIDTLGDYTIATYDDGAYPPLSTLGLLPLIGDQAPPTPAGATLLFTGRAFVLGQPMKIAVFRTG